MKNKKWIYLITIILIALGYSFLSRPKNNIEIMEKMISKHIKTNHTVIIYNAINDEDYRLVSYILETKGRYEKVGYAKFILNSKGKYELLNIVDPDRVIEKADDITIYEFSNLKSQFSDLDIDNYSINPSIFIISNNPRLAKIERSLINGEIKNRAVVVNPSISFFHDLDGVNNVIYNFYDEKDILLNKAEDMVVVSPITISNNELPSFNGQTHYLRLNMTKGRYYINWEPSPYMGTIWEGNYTLELVDDKEEVIDYIELNKIFGASTLIFTSSFDLEFDDYNDDGNLDFTIGQYASSSIREYKLFTITEEKKIEKLPIKDHSFLYISNTTGYYSTKLTKLDNITFKIEIYDNTEGKWKEEVFEWDGKKFIMY